MNEYYVSDGNGGKAVPIPVKQDPFKDILKKPEARKVEEKPKDEVVAGDATIEQSKAVFNAKEEAVAEDPKKVVYGHCNNCRLELTEDKIVKTPIDYVRAEDGTLTKAASRFSIFCKNCMKFVTIIDKDAAKMLQDMIRKNAR